MSAQPRSKGFARPTAHSDVTQSRKKQKTQPNPICFLNSVNLIACGSWLGSFLICAFAALRDIFDLRHQLLQGETLGRSGFAAGSGELSWCGMRGLGG
jgi:hypothetical protein